VIKSPWYKSLRVQLACWMTIALLPLGLIAILQTQRVAEDALRSAELALITQTERFALEETMALERAFATVDLLSSSAQELLANNALCSAVAMALKNNIDEFGVVALLPATGTATCSSSDEIITFAQLLRTATPPEDDGTVIAVDRSSPTGEQTGFYILRPYRIDGNFAGFVLVSITYQSQISDINEDDNPDILDILLIDDDGMLLSSQVGIESGNVEMPQNFAVDNATRRTFQATNQAGELRRYALLPIEGGPAAILGVWDPIATSPASLRQVATPALFPALMWLSSLAVVLIALYSLVLRHVRQLRSDMDRFAATRLLEPHKREQPQTTEMMGLYQDFIRMAEIIIREEANVENRLREREALLREVHHRVKNNLQLISSIMNMQIRRADHQETRNVLERLQDRVLSLALIHRDLQEDFEGGLVDAGALVTDLVDRMTAVALPDGDTIEVHKDIADVLLIPDQAVPLSFIVAEALTNVMKYGGATCGMVPELRVSMQQADDRVTLVMENATFDVENNSGTGMGSQLIEAFADQLGGSVSIDRKKDSYTLSLTFTIKAGRPVI